MIGSRNECALAEHRLFNCGSKENNPQNGSKVTMVFQNPITSEVFSFIFGWFRGIYLAGPVRQPGMDSVAEALRAASARAMKAKSKHYPSKRTPANSDPGEGHYGYRGTNLLNILVWCFWVIYHILFMHHISLGIGTKFVWNHHSSRTIFEICFLNHHLPFFCDCEIKQFDYMG